MIIITNKKKVIIMNKNIFLLISMILLISAFASAELTISVTEPANNSVISSRNNLKIIFVPETNESDIICDFNMENYDTKGIEINSGSAYTKTISIISDGNYLWSANCTDSASQTANTGNYYFTIKAFTYSAGDVAKAPIDLLVSILAGLVGFASLIAIVLVIRYVKK